MISVKSLNAATTIAHVSRGYSALGVGIFCYQVIVCQHQFNSEHHRRTPGRTGRTTEVRVFNVSRSTIARLWYQYQHQQMLSTNYHCFQLTHLRQRCNTTSSPAAEIPIWCFTFPDQYRLYSA